jgi:hypothetical protein
VNCEKEPTKGDGDPILTAESLSPKHILRRLDALPTEFAQRQQDQPVLNYEKYLKSALWRRIRKRVLERDGGRCLRCGGKATRVHHRSYAEDVKSGNNDDMLASVCKGCHQVIHWDDFGKPRSAKETDRLLLERDWDTDFPAPKIDLRRHGNERPAGWERWTGRKLAAWQREHERLYLLHRLRKGVSPKMASLLRRLLNGFGMDNAAIDKESLKSVSERKSRKA